MGVPFLFQDSLMRVAHRNLVWIVAMKASNRRLSRRWMQMVMVLCPRKIWRTNFSSLDFGLFWHFDILWWLFQPRALDFPEILFGESIETCFFFSFGEALQTNPRQVSGFEHVFEGTGWNVTQDLRGSKNSGDKKHQETAEPLHVYNSNCGRAFKSILSFHWHSRF